MANKDPIVPAALDVSVFQAGGAGTVTTVHGSEIIAPSGAQAASAPGGAGPGGWNSGWPVVMPQPSVIVVTVGQKPETGVKPEKAHSEVVKRP